MFPYIITDTTINVMLPNGDARSVTDDNREFQALREAIRDGAWDEVPVILDRACRIREYLRDSKVGDVELVGGEIHYKGHPCHNVVARQILRLRDEGFDITPLVNFLDNLMQNPSWTAVQELYLFLQAGNMVITPDGHFLAYKRVRENWKDYHTNTFDNSIGRIVEVPRWSVDDNRDNTCSNGLHVCSLSYLKSFYCEEGRIIIVKVNPRDVVSIPSDYNNAKGRVCRYEVVGEHHSETTEFTTSPVWVHEEMDLDDIFADDDEEEY